MLKQLHLRVPEPCHENWNEMTPADKGRHCNACSKVVVDFTVMSDRQIIDYFAKTTHKTCGHFTASQLNRTIIKPKKPLKYLKYLWQILIPAMLVSCGIDTGKKRQISNAKATIEKVEQSDDLEISGMLLTKINSVNLPDIALDIVPIVQGDVKYLSITKGFTVPVVISDSTIEQCPLIPTEYTTVIIENIHVNNDSTVGIDSVIASTDTVNILKVAVVDPIKSYLSQALRTPSFRIYPNPINANQPLHIQFLKAGNYQLQVFDNAGKLYTSATYNNIVANQTVNLNLSASLAKGMYYVRCIDAFTQQQFTNKIMVN